ncbi:MAG TPA: LytTR family DNA-binding domain-containing protein [Flavilitoribacter sp.]|nr:LytTR family DNA-binding domain-containing protein [Flavilitoribacter sp.]HMQ87335.1 LytTR family DNA-binding domain-containing protein [Flavilitoribacter sp.]
MTALIVEDMPQAAQVLQKDLETHCPEVEVIGTAHSIVAAAKLLNQTDPDLIFLDILLGDGTGFDLLEILPNLRARIIFVTASDEFAIRAFRYAAVDYLLKPIEPAQLAEAVRRAKIQLPGADESIHLLKETIRRPEALPNRISLASQERILVVEIEEIIRCEADGNNTRFVLSSGEKVFVTKTLKQYEQLLEQHGFLRVHQSHLVNTRYIHEFVKRDGGYIRMKNGDIAPVSVRKKAEIMTFFEGL